MRTAYRTTAAASFTTESHVRSSVFINTFLYKNPSKIRVDSSPLARKGIRSSLIRISDGGRIFVKEANKPEFNQVRFSIRAFSVGLPVNLESLCFFDWDQQLSTAGGRNMSGSTFKILLNQTWKGKKWTVLQETAAAQKVVCRYFIDPKTFLIWRTITVDMPGGTSTNAGDCWLTKLNPAAKIDDSMFTVAHV